ncbi:MAG: hypothetical protein ABI851_02395 [Saprospiraceae bacterium]
MAFIDKLKSVFIVTDDSKKIDQTKQESSQNTSSKNETEYAPLNVSSGTNSQKFVELLAGILEKNNFPGYDYFEYKKAIQAVSKIGNMEEMMMHKTVYAAAQSMNVDAKYLIQTAKKYLDILENESTNFNQAAENYLKQQIQTKNTELSALQKNIEECKNTIKELTSELVKNEARLADLGNELKSVNQKVDMNKSDFNSSYSSFVDEIKLDIQKMEKYLL